MIHKWMGTECINEQLRYIYIHIHYVYNPHNLPIGPHTLLKNWNVSCSVDTGAFVKTNATEHDLLCREKISYVSTHAYCFACGLSEVTAYKAVVPYG